MLEVTETNFLGIHCQVSLLVITIALKLGSRRSGCYILCPQLSEPSSPMAMPCQSIDQRRPFGRGGRCLNVGKLINIFVTRHATDIDRWKVLCSAESLGQGYLCDMHPNVGVYRTDVIGGVPRSSTQAYVRTKIYLVSDDTSIAKYTQVSGSWAKRQLVFGYSKRGYASTGPEFEPTNAYRGDMACFGSQDHGPCVLCFVLAISENITLPANPYRKRLGS